MNTPPHSTPQPSPGAQPSLNTMSLGRTAGQRSAEMLAGIRAIYMRHEPVAQALSTWPGMVMARLLKGYLGRTSIELENYIGVRTLGFTKLAERYLAARPGPHVIVEMAAGFSPRGVLLARALPDATVIEVDLPGVVEEKQRRLRSPRVGIPPNMTWHGVDLGMVPLAEVLGGLRADVVTAEGLTPYFTPQQNQDILRNALAALKPGGLFQADFFAKIGEQITGRSLEMFKRQAGSLLCVVESKEQTMQMLTDAGFVRPAAYTPTEVTQMFPDLPSPTADVEFLALAYAPDA